MSDKMMAGLNARQDLIKGITLPENLIVTGESEFVQELASTSIMKTFLMSGVKNIICDCAHSGSVASSLRPEARIRFLSFGMDYSVIRELPEYKDPKNTVIFSDITDIESAFSSGKDFEGMAVLYRNAYIIVIKNAKKFWNDPDSYKLLDKIRESANEDKCDSVGFYAAYIYMMQGNIIGKKKGNVRIFDIHKLVETINKEYKDGTGY